MLAPKAGSTSLATVLLNSIGYFDGGKALSNVCKNLTLTKSNWNFRKIFIKEEIIVVWIRKTACRHGFLGSQRTGQMVGSGIHVIVLFQNEPKISDDIFKNCLNYIFS